jgi:hypothetical protein
MGSHGKGQQIHGVFFLMNDHIVDVDSSQSQKMKCIMCHNMQQNENNQNFTQS